MKTLKLTVAMLAMVTLTLVSCSDQISSSMDPASKSISGGQTLFKPVIHSATGSVHVAWFYGAPYYDNCTFNAKEHSDGSFSGTARYHDKETGMWIQGNVIDLKIDNGNQAKVSCCIRKSNIPEEYAYLFFVVIDNGEGSNCDPDIASWFINYPEEPPVGDPTVAELIAMSSDEFISLLVLYGLVPPTFEYLNGNIQVH